MSICEYYSAKLDRHVILPARSYWLGLWMDWATGVTAYVELPADPDSPQKSVGDFWVEYAGKDYLIDVDAEAVADTASSVTPWELPTDGYEPVDTGRGRITPRWMWARRSVLHSLEQAHPYAVSAHLQGGLKLTCSKLLTEWPVTGHTVGEASELTGANRFVVQCAIFHMVRTGKLELDWTRGLSLNTRLRKARHASQG